MTERQTLAVALLIMWCVCFFVAWAFMGFINLNWNVATWSELERIGVAGGSLAGPFYVWWTANEK